MFELEGLTAEVMHAAGYDILTVHAEVDYTATARLGETLIFSARAERVGNTSLTFELESRVDGTDRVTTTGRVVFMTVDAESHQPIPVPTSVREALGV